VEDSHSSKALCWFLLPLVACTICGLRRPYVYVRDSLTLVSCACTLKKLFSSYNSGWILKIFWAHVSVSAVVLSPKCKNLVLSSNLLCIVVRGNIGVSTNASLLKQDFRVGLCTVPISSIRPKMTYFINCYCLPTPVWHNLQHTTLNTLICFPVGLNSNMIQYSLVKKTL
jgi:hypothetical protein